MPLVSFSLSIDAQQIQRYYRGEVKTVLVKASNGLKIQFPANLVLPFVTRQGVYGHYQLEYAPNGKVISLKKIGLQ